MNVYKILKDTYYDSVSLMSQTAKLKKELPVKEFIMLMGSDMNKDMIKDVGLYQSDMEKAGPNDLILAADLEDESIKDSWADTVMEAFNDTSKKSDSKEETSYKTIDQAVKSFDGNMAIISVPGEHAAEEAYTAIGNGLNVMLFSDNVDIEDEIRLKDMAIEKDLLMMGADCGTAIINHKGLCFANDVNAGNIGLVAASGTGLQEVSVIIDRFGGGITQAIGVGGRDLSEEVGGRMMLKGIDILDEDPETEVIALISKPPHPSVEEKIFNHLKKVSKPVIVGFIDSKRESKGSITFASTLADTAFEALKQAGIEVDTDKTLPKEIKTQIKDEKTKFSDTQSKVKGLFCGGTLTSEALSILRDEGLSVTSNVAKKKEEKMDDPFKSDGHNLVDLGEDVFTEGKPHPMLEPTIRLERMLEEAENPETAVLLMDFELGYGSHEDPVGVTIDTIKVARKRAEDKGNHLAIVAYVCGTKTDFQGLSQSEEALREEGVILARTNAEATRIASELVKERE